MSQDPRRDEEQSTARRAGILGLNYTDVSTLVEKTLYKDLLTLQEIYRLRVIPLTATEHQIHFGITTSTSQQTLQMLIQKFPDQQISYSIISDSGYRDYVHLYNPPKKIEYTDIKIGQQDDQLTEQVSATLDQVKSDDILAYLVQQAHRLNASDIHLESQDNHTRIRFRIDGVLHVVARLQPEKYRVLVASVASAGNISTSSDDAQQGHIAEKVAMADGTQVDVNVRLETVPTINGLDMVMRLFNMQQSMYKLDNLGLSSSERKVIDDIINRPSGLVLVVGPTGSGKTTTLYSMLNSLNSNERKIITIEDPVEYRFAGITQLSITSQNSNETSFADKLRATLRLDPDIVMVGEVRDMDTAKTALQAALTGHLVLSTFHASSAAAALVRLMDVIGQNPLFMSAIRLVMAQRLVRRLDPQNRQAFEPDETMRTQLQHIVDTLPDGVPRPDLSHVTLYNPVPTQDNPYGFNGQVALREQFTVTPAIRELLDSNHSVSTATIEQVAVKAGMQTMLQDGVNKVLAGETTLQEVMRVLG